MDHSFNLKKNTFKNTGTMGKKYWEKLGNFVSPVSGPAYTSSVVTARKRSLRRLYFHRHL